MTYEEANWPRLSPAFREAHNRLRKAKGMPPIPPPAKDEYVAPPPRKPTPVVISEADAMAEYRAQTGRFDAMMARIHGNEGFEVKDPGGLGMAASPQPRRNVRAGASSEGFTIRR